MVEGTSHLRLLIVCKSVFTSAEFLMNFEKRPRLNAAARATGPEARGVKPDTFAKFKDSMNNH